jgi:hypothetical protein
MGIHLKREPNQAAAVNAPVALRFQVGTLGGETLTEDELTTDYADDAD